MQLAYWPEPAVHLCGHSRVRTVPEGNNRCVFEGPRTLVHGVLRCFLPHTNHS